MQPQNPQTPIQPSDEIEKEAKNNLIDVAAGAETPPNKPKHRIWRTLLIVIGGIVILIGLSIVLISVLIFKTLGGVSSTPNSAADGLKPIMSRIEQLGGTKICDRGDNGHSLDNNIPNYQVYYLAPDSQLEQNIVTAAKQQGLVLSVDSSHIQELQSNSYSANGNEGYNSNSSYLSSTIDGKALAVTITRNGSLPLDCSGSSIPYGQQKTVTGSTDLVRLNMTYPQVQK